MTLVELFVAHVLGVPQVVGDHLQIVGSLFYWMLVEAVKACLVDDVDNCFFCFGNGERRVAGSHLAVSLHAEHRAEVGTLLWIARCVACHRDLS